MKSLILIFAIISATNAITFNCTFQFVATTNLPSTYTCNNAIVSNVEDGAYLRGVYGQHESGKSDSDVKYLFILHVTHLAVFPRGIENFFPNLEAIYIGNSSITSLSGDELEPFGNLFWLSFSRNADFERIPGNLFNSNPLMRHIQFYDNNIKHVGVNLFSSLTNLIFLDFRFNYCVHKWVSNNTAEIQVLINHLSTNCTDIEITTTTTPLTTTLSTTPMTTTTEQSSCGDTNEIICDLQEQNQILIETNAEMKEEIMNLNSKIDDMSTSMEEKFNELSQENAQMKQKLDEVLEGILELSTRPCG